MPGTEGGDTNKLNSLRDADDDASPIDCYCRDDLASNTPRASSCAAGAEHCNTACSKAPPARAHRPLFRLWADRHRPQKYPTKLEFVGYFHYTLHEPKT